MPVLSWNPSIQIALGTLVGCLLGYLLVRFCMLKVEVTYLRQERDRLQNDRKFWMDAFHQESRLVISLATQFSQFDSQLRQLAGDMSRFFSTVKTTAPPTPALPPPNKQVIESALSSAGYQRAATSPSSSSGTDSPTSSTASDSAKSSSPAADRPKRGRYFPGNKRS